MCSLAPAALLHIARDSSGGGWGPAQGLELLCMPEGTDCSLSPAATFIVVFFFKDLFLVCTLLLGLNCQKGSLSHQLCLLAFHLLPGCFVFSYSDRIISVGLSSNLLTFP
jgi:hypothetical protein